METKAQVNIRIDSENRGRALSWWEQLPHEERPALILKYYNGTQIASGLTGREIENIWQSESRMPNDKLFYIFTALQDFKQHQYTYGDTNIVDELTGRLLNAENEMIAFQRNFFKPLLESHQVLIDALKGTHSDLLSLHSNMDDHYFKRSEGQQVLKNRMASILTLLSNIENELK